MHVSRRLLLGLGAALVVIAVLLVAVGLDRADKIASIIGALAGLAGLGLSLAGLRSGSANGTGDAPGTTRWVRGPFGIYLRGNQGVQISRWVGRAEQHNYFGDRRPPGEESREARPRDHDDEDDD
jgi:hypothetical protein